VCFFIVTSSQTIIADNVSFFLFKF
jgi:hypothetical protein